MFPFRCKMIKANMRYLNYEFKFNFTHSLGLKWEHSLHHMIWLLSLVSPFKFSDQFFSFLLTLSGFLVNEPIYSLLFFIFFFSFIFLSNLLLSSEVISCDIRMFFEFLFVPILNESSWNWIYAKHVDATSITMHNLIKMHITQISIIKIHIIDQ